MTNTKDTNRAIEPTIDGYPLWSGLPPPVMSDAQIRDIFMTNGFTIKDGQDDLKPYVYAAARDLLAAQALNSVSANSAHTDDELTMVKSFCSDCGKRNFADHIHTCTPPADISKQSTDAENVSNLTAKINQSSGDL